MYIHYQNIKSLNPVPVEVPDSIRFSLKGLAGEFTYTAYKEEKAVGYFSGDELMNIGMVGTAICAHPPEVLRKY